MGWGRGKEQRPAALGTPDREISPRSLVIDTVEEVRGRYYNYVADGYSIWLQGKPPPSRFSPEYVALVAGFVRVQHDIGKVMDGKNRLTADRNDYTFEFPFQDAKVPNKEHRLRRRISVTPFIEFLLDEERRLKETRYTTRGGRVSPEYYDRLLAQNQRNFQVLIDNSESFDKLHEAELADSVVSDSLHAAGAYILSLDPWTDKGEKANWRKGRDNEHIDRELIVPAA